MAGRTLAIVAALWLLFLACGAWGFRCGSELIQPGDRRVQVLKACGEPVSRDSWEEARPTFYSLYGRYWSAYEKVLVEEWIYNLGPQHFMRIIRFENGEVVKIETDDYGF